MSQQMAGRWSHSSVASCVSVCSCPGPGLDCNMSVVVLANLVAFRRIRARFKLGKRGSRRSIPGPALLAERSWLMVGRL
jgi:hypothetical protein